MDDKVFEPTVKWEQDVTKEDLHREYGAELDRLLQRERDLIRQVNEAKREAKCGKVEALALELYRQSAIDSYVAVEVVAKTAWAAARAFYEAGEVANDG